MCDLQIEILANDFQTGRKIDSLSISHDPLPR